MSQRQNERARRTTPSSATRSSNADWDQFEELLLRQPRNDDDDQTRAVDMPHAKGPCTVARRTNAIRRDGLPTTEHREDHSVRHGTGDTRIPVGRSRGAQGIALRPRRNGTCRRSRSDCAAPARG